MCVFFSGYGDHRDLHVLTHSFPTRRSSDLYPAEDLVMYLVRQAAPRLRQPAMIRDRVAARQSQELPQRQRIRTAPDNPAFAVDALEIADQQHAEIADRKSTRLNSSH